ncbi:MAG: hypothetical protein ACI4N3_05230 [Alphaproteobacteria bacterium]
MKKRLTFDEFKDKLAFFDKQISAHNEFINSSNKNERLQIAYYQGIINHIKMQKEKLLKNNVDYIKQLEQEK